MQHVVIENLLFMLILFLVAITVVFVVLHRVSVKEERRAAVCRSLSGLLGNVTVATVHDLLTVLGGEDSFANSIAYRLQTNFEIMQGEGCCCTTFVRNKVELLNPAKLLEEMRPVPFGYYRFLVIVSPIHLRMSLVSCGREWLGNCWMEFDPSKPLDPQVDRAITGLLDQLGRETRLAEAFPALG